MADSPRPPFDPELSETLAALADEVPPTFTPDMVEPSRSASATTQVGELLALRAGVSHREQKVPGYDAAELLVSVFAAEPRPGAGPGFFYIHGGGMVTGNRFVGVDLLLDWVALFGGVCVSVEHRLAPEFPDPTPLRTATPRSCGPPNTEPSWASIPNDSSSSGGALAAASRPAPRCWPATGRGPDLQVSYCCPP